MRQKRAVLYELLTERDAERTIPNGDRRHRGGSRFGEEERAESSEWLAPGRAIRLPVGYIFIGLAAVMVLLLGAYIFGSARGDGTAGPGAPPGTSAAEEQARIAAAQGGSGQAPSDDRNARADQPRESGPPRSANGWGPIESDPRKKDFNYFFIVHTTRENAIRVAEFCRQEGLEAYVVRENNARSRGVCVLPGYTWDDRSSDRIRRLEDHIRRVIQKWNVHVGRDELTTYIAQKYKG